MRWTNLLAAGVLVALTGCASGNGDDTDSAGGALASPTARVNETESTAFLAPTIQAGDHRWSTVVVQSAAFEGTLAFRTGTDDDTPDQLVVVDRKKNAIAFVSADSVGATDDWNATRSELGGAAGQLTVMAGDVEGGDTRVASFVNDQNKCFLKEAGLALGLVAVVVAAPIVIEAAPAIAAGAVATVQEAAGAVAENGLRAALTQAARAVAANPRLQKILAFEIVKTGVKGWLLFSEKGHELEKSVLDQAKIVWNASCSIPSPDALDGTMLVGP